MDLVIEFLAILFGVIVSIVLPVMIRWLKPQDKLPKEFWDYIKSVYLPYVKAGVAAIVVSILILMFAPEDLGNWKAAAMLGLGWQSFLKSLLTA